MSCNHLDLARNLGVSASDLIKPGSVLVVDESLYEYNGACPIRRYIPRKPHPNGVLTYALSGFFNVGLDKIPYVLDFEPYTLDNLVTPQEAMMALFRRLRTRKPNLRPHLVVDSAFGSFDRLHEIIAEGGNATMSMPATVKPWLWELLDFKCGIDQGRLALLPASNIVISSFKVLAETGNTHQIKTISSGCLVGEVGDEEETVSRIEDRRETADGTIEYLTEFMDGHTEWLAARDFIDDDGTTNMTWLGFVDEADLEAAFKEFTHANLKVQFHHLPLSTILTLLFRIYALLKVGNRLETSLAC
jgi:hypothetical protein